MSVEFIGFITNNNASETIVRSGPVLDPPYIETVAKAHELAGFDRALLAFHSTTPDALQVAQHVLTITKKLKVMIAQRPGFTAPTLLARQLATLDQFYGGRVSLHVITGGNAVELRQDGRSLRRPKSRPGKRPKKSWRAPPRSRTRPAIASPPMATPPPARGACSRSPTRAAGSTSGCGLRSQSSPAPTATPPRWSARL